MTLLALYIISVIGGGVAAVTNVSKGSLFTGSVKFIVLAITLVILIASSVYVVMTFGLWNILGLIAAYIISAWLFSFIWITVFYSGKY